MRRILVLSDSMEDVRLFTANDEAVFFPIRQIPPSQHHFSLFASVYAQLKASVDLRRIDLVIGEYIESLPLVFLMRLDGFAPPAILIPHTNPYPLNALVYFLLIAETEQPDDVVLCGSINAVRGYRTITGLPALNIATFGVKPHYKPMDQALARRRLRLPLERKLILYTGRFMPDKGLEELLGAVALVRRATPNCQLVMSTTHVEQEYYNRLAPALADVIAFHRLPIWAMPTLYNAADLFVSTATSIFETYGKSPLEAISCGVPAVLPQWDGFPSFMSARNGALCSVRYLRPDPRRPFSFASADVEDCARRCLEQLAREGLAKPVPPLWSRYDVTMPVLADLVARRLGRARRIRPYFVGQITVDRYPASVRAFLRHHRLRTCWDLVRATADLVSQKTAGEPQILEAIHNQLFVTMAASGHPDA